MKKYNLNKKKTSLLFKIIVGIIRFFYPKTKFIQGENIPNEPTIFISNHAQMHGPIITQLSFPVDRYIWCIGEMMETKEVPKYAYKDFWSHKPKCVKWFYKLLSYIIAPFSFIFRNAYCIPLYKDTRIIETFKKTVEHLNANESIIIFPESTEKFNEIINDFQKNFVDVAKYYYKKTKKELTFTPMYIAPKLKTVTFGKPIKYNSQLSSDAQREEICNYLKEEITRIAKDLPRHKVVPYDNVSKKYYVYSK